MTIYLLIALPIVFLVSLGCIVAIIVTVIRGFGERPVECERCGTIRTQTKRGKPNYTSPTNYNHIQACRMIGHAWTINPKEQQ